MPTPIAPVTTPDLAPRSQPPAPAGPPRTVCLVNLSNYPVMLSGYSPEDDADALPSGGAIVPRGGEIEFGLPQTV